MKYWQGRELFTVGCDEAVTERNRDNLVEEKMLSGELWMGCPTNNDWMVDAPLGTGQCYSQVMVACRGRIFWHSAEQKVVGTFRNERREMDDLISRQAAIDMKFSHGINENGLLYVSFGEMVNNLKQLPSAQPEPQWIPIKTRPMTEDETIGVTSMVMMSSTKRL